VRAFQVDAEHGNAYTAWQRMGSPASPSPEQYAQLERAGQLTEVEAPAAVVGKAGRVTLRLTLPRQSVALIVLER
jgi:xylan 1,4-beta-xylosidase